MKKLGLGTSYAKVQLTRRTIRKLMAANLLTEDRMRVAFYDLLCEEDEEGSLRVFCNYIESNWITSNTWPPSTWSVFMQCTRTNNDVEGWHNTINKSRPANMNLECLIEILASEVKMILLHAKLLSQGRILRMHSLTTPRHFPPSPLI